MTHDPGLNRHKVEIRWEKLPDGSRRCVGEKIDTMTRQVLANERILLPLQVRRDFQTQHGIEPYEIVEQTVRGRLQEDLVRFPGSTD